MGMFHAIKKFSLNFWVNQIANLPILPQRMRIAIYRLAGMELGNCGIYSGQFFCGPNVKVGDRTFINHKCFFENTLSPIEIGEDCSIGMEVVFCAATHEIGEGKKRAGLTLGREIKVGNGSWIGTRAVILPGVTIGEGCIIAAGSVVNKDCKPNCIYAGVPAKLIKKLL